MASPQRLLALALLPALASCSRPHDVVVYAAHDQVHSEPILREFERRTGLRVRAEFDLEAHKTVGLVRRIQEEAARRTRCDVFWNNESAHTIRLAEQGLLAVYDSPVAADIPAEFKDPERRWTGFAARARCIIVNTELVDPAEITSMWDLADPRWKGRVGMARPLSGTTLSHMAALYAKLGEEEARRYLNALLANDIALPPGNGPLARLVGAGTLAFGWTDTDDYNVRRLAGDPVAIVYPDADTIGTLVIPNTVMILRDAPNPDAARQLVDFLLSPEVERMLADGRAAQIPLHRSLAEHGMQIGLEGLVPMDVDPRAIAREIDARGQELQELFLD